MKRILFLTAAMLLLVAGVTLAQTPTTSAPGPTLQREPGEANNNLPNPGTPQAEPQTGTTPTTATETVDENQNDPSAATDTTGTMDTTGATDATAQDADVTGADTTTTNRRDTTTATGTMDTTDTDTTATDTTTAGAMSDDASLPDTGSELPLLGLAGLVALGAAAGLRQLR